MPSAFARTISDADVVCWAKSKAAGGGSNSRKHAWLRDAKNRWVRTCSGAVGIVSEDGPLAVALVRAIDIMAASKGRDAQDVPKANGITGHRPKFKTCVNCVNRTKPIGVALPTQEQHAVQVSA